MKLGSKMKNPTRCLNFCERILVFSFVFVNGKKSQSLLDKKASLRYTEIPCLNVSYRKKNVQAQDTLYKCTL